MESLAEFKRHIDYVRECDAMSKMYVEALACATIMDSIGQFDRWNVWWKNCPTRTLYGYDNDWETDDAIYHEAVWYWQRQHYRAKVARDIHQLPVGEKARYAEELTREKQRFNELVTTPDRGPNWTWKKGVNLRRIQEGEEFAGDLLHYYIWANGKLVAMMK